MCRSSTGSEIYDLAWSPDGTFFVTGSMDNVARIYNATNGMIWDTDKTVISYAHWKQAKRFGK